MKIQAQIRSYTLNVRFSLFFLDFPWEFGGFPNSFQKTLLFWPLQETLLNIIQHWLQHFLASDLWEKSGKVKDCFLPMRYHTELKWDLCTVMTLWSVCTLTANPAMLWLIMLISRLWWDLISLGQFGGLFFFFGTTAWSCPPPLFCCQFVFMTHTVNKLHASSTCT